MFTPLRPLALLACLATPLLAQEAALETAEDDPALRAAIMDARSHLDVVLSRLTGEEGGLHPALNLKVALPVQHFDVDSEVLWVDRIARDGEGYTGHLANQPAHLPGHQMGDRVRFGRAQIVDWSVLGEDGRMSGHYTTRVLMRAMTRTQAGQIRDMLSADPMPEAWR
ncbi:DUF2314 domain-containing protein [Sagittula salina]|uniref:DUF2314 domain-containing protein n=1 Tax=Sagittula salina TaxID=2820268 RepID=A0A940RYR1_9RHOB|nr:DUF2314 domain-containing protein [Sagittula salina]MBP0481158.1 DUF2314 domain-containing protein [Sagittula salina]